MGAVHNHFAKQIKEWYFRKREKKELCEINPSVGRLPPGWALEQVVGRLGLVA